MVLVSSAQPANSRQRRGIERRKQWFAGFGAGRNVIYVAIVAKIPRNWAPPIANPQTTFPRGKD
jgi:hypothetical protein